jgi:hypothetical protein
MIFKNDYFEKLYLMKNLKFNNHLVICLMIMILKVVKYKRYMRVSVCVSECVHSIYMELYHARAYTHKPLYMHTYTPTRAYTRCEKRKHDIKKENENHGRFSGKIVSSQRYVSLVSNVCL